MGKGDSAEGMAERKKPAGRKGQQLDRHMLVTAEEKEGSFPGNNDSRQAPRMQATVVVHFLADKNLKYFLPTTNARFCAFVLKSCD